MRESKEAELIEDESRKRWRKRKKCDTARKWRRENEEKGRV